MKTRKYLASCDNGHDYFSIEFYSEHRANSKANFADCKREIERNKGYKVAKNTTILNTCLYNIY